MLNIKETILEIINEQTEVDMSGVEVKFDDNYYVKYQKM